MSGNNLENFSNVNQETGVKDYGKTIEYKNSNFFRKPVIDGGKTKYEGIPVDLSGLSLFKDPSGQEQLITKPYHQRAAEVPNFEPVEDKYGNIFYVLSIKGLGFLHPEHYVSRRDNYYGKEGQGISIHETDEFPWGYKVLGLVDDRVWETLVKEEKNLTKKGLRCEGILGVIKLRNVILGSEDGDKNQKTSIEDLRDLLKKQAEDIGLPEDSREDLDDFQPVLIVRVTRDNTRIKEFCKPVLESGGDTEVEERKKMLENVFKSLNDENKRKDEESFYDVENTESVKDYIKETFKIAGQNLAILQNQGKIMWFLNSGNITLSLAEVVDLDSIVPLLGRYKIDAYSKIHSQHDLPVGIVKDVRDELYALGKMWLAKFRGIVDLRDMDRQDIYREFLDSYTAKLDIPKVEALLKKNAISVLNGVEYKLSDDRDEDEKLQKFLAKYRTKIGYVLDSKDKLDKLFDGEEREKVVKIIENLAKVKETDKLTELVRNFAKTLIVDGYRIPPIKCE